jgi:demethylmenaquinone methyltransferase / 2-methoxy-6-polyprenyl-1,4-benzoquinol methylase
MPSAHPLQEYYSRIYKTYDLVNRLFTFGMDARWRRHTVEACLKNHPVSILDLCCGTGDLAISICRVSGKNVHITGFDLNPGMLTLARQKASRLKASPIEFIQGDARSMPFRDGEFDCITIGFGFRNLTFENPDRDLHFREISRIMKPGARLLILESSVPRNRLIAFFYRAYLRFFLVPLGGLLSGNWNAYRYLAGSSAGFYSFEELGEMLRNYQLTLKTERKYLFGSVNLLVATRI